jgi:predicted nucleotidyltransferase
MSVQVSQQKLDHEMTQHLPGAVEAALDDFRRKLLELFPGEISQLILYGSYARGEAASDSDVDVLVVVKWPQEQLPDGTYLAWLDDPGWEQIIDLTVDVLLERGVHMRHILYERFSESDLRTLCFDLGLEYNGLPGDGTANKARELTWSWPGNGGVEPGFGICVCNQGTSTDKRMRKRISGF